MGIQMPRKMGMGMRCWTDGNGSNWNGNDFTQMGGNGNNKSYSGTRLMRNSMVQSELADRIVDRLTGNSTAVKSAAKT